jgi:hypothetical protein
MLVKCRAVAREDYCGLHTFVSHLVDSVLCTFKCKISSLNYIHVTIYLRKAQ